MESHEALQRFDKISEGHEESQGEGGPLARNAAVVVAVLAGFLAIATFLTNEAVKEVITGETKGADVNAQLEANSVKTTVAGANAVILRVVGTGNPKAAAAVAKAEELERTIQAELQPVDARLSAKVRSDEHQRDHADQTHLLFELSEVGLQIGIVLAGISILVRRRWMLRGGALAGCAGVVLLAVGLLY